MNPFINRLRGLLAIGVVFWHVSAIPGQVQTTADAWQGVFGPLVLFSGFNYVVGFVVISGYCIARSTLNRDFNIVRYAALRITRIFPTLIAGACIAGLVEVALFGSPGRLTIWSSGITAHNFALSLIGMSGFYGQFGSYAPSYTVSYELLYYLIWGVVFAVTPKRFAAPVSGLAGVFLYFVLPPEYHFALALLGAWLIGAALAIHEKEIIAATRYVPLWLIWFVTACAYVKWNELTQPLGPLWSAPQSLTYIPLGLLFAIIMAGHLSRPAKAMQLDDWLGDISYPLFLVHGPVLITVGSALKLSGVSLSYGLLVLVCLGCSMLAAQAVLILVDRPVMRLRRMVHASPIAAPDNQPSPSIS